MSLFRSVMGLFRGNAGKDGEKAAAPPEEQATTVKAQPVGARREAKREARPDPNKPGWGLSTGQEISKDSASHD